MSWRVAVYPVVIILVVAWFTSTPGAATTSTSQVFLPLVADNPSPAPTPIPFFRDDFSDPSSGWPIGNDGTVTRAYTSGTYQILIGPSGVIGRSGHNLTATDFDARVTVQAAGPTGSAGTIGLYFGSTPQGFYDFEIGYPNFFLAYFDEASKSRTYLTNLTNSPEILPDPAANEVEVIRAGSQIRLLINGQQVDQVSDSVSETGNVGLAATSNTVGFDSRFTHFDLSYSSVTPTPLADPPGTPTATPIVTQAAEAVAFQENVAHDGSTMQPGLTPPFQKLWTAQITGVPGYPLIADGMVYASSVTNTYTLGWVFAFDERTGTPNWGPVTVAENGNAPNLAFDDGSLFIPTYDFSGAGSRVHLISVDARSGVQRWMTTLPLETSTDTIPVATQGSVFVSPNGVNSVLAALDTDNGSILWNRPLSGSGTSPVISPDGVFVADACDAYKLQRATGDQLWHFSAGCLGGGSAQSVYYRGRLYSSSISGGVVLDAATGERVGSFPNYSMPTFSGNIGIVDASALPGEFSGVITAFDATSGATLWSISPSDPPGAAPPLVNNNQVFVGTESGRIDVLDPPTGAILATADTGTGDRVTALAAGDGLLVAVAGDSVIAFGIPGGPIGTVSRQRSGDHGSR